MYEKITSYHDVFGKNAVSESELQKKIESFVTDFMQSEFMNPNAMEAMEKYAWVSKSELKNAASTMTADEACTCLSAFVQQESFIPGILLDLTQQGVLPQILGRLKELDT